MSANQVRLELALLSHLSTVAVQERGVGLGRNPVAVVRKPYDFTEAWEEARARAGMTDLRFHDLRHEAVSRLVEVGLGDQEVAAISGHKSMQMLRRYTHLRAEDLVARLDQLMF